MRRFFVDPVDVGEKEILISDPGDFRHISKVLRLKPGDVLAISDGDRWEYRCRLKEMREGQEAVFTIEDKQAIAGQSSYEIILFQGLPKAGKMSDIIKKSVELGVFRIVPVLMKRSLAKDIGKYRQKTDRFNQIAFEASKQSRRLVPAEVLPAIDFQEALEQLKACQIVVFPYEGEQVFSIKDFFLQLRKEGAIREGMRIGIVIGPEGGFSESEVSAMMERAYKPVCIARTILRTETAGPAVMAMLNYELEL